ncbi:MAG: hypothetical protein BGO70_06920 [Bacteroidetes bacterium 43-93]|nr:hypothetical protein [Bacteroidota bacterium]OJW97514.1 MAG: hypothetical protein BGO70_06920 [Bacteroidetes bacterium 43-93]
MKKLIPALAILLIVACNNTTNNRDEKIRTAIITDANAIIDSNAYHLDSLRIVHIDSLTEKEAMEQLIADAESDLSFYRMEYNRDTQSVTNYTNSVKLADKLHLQSDQQDRKQLAYYTATSNYYQALANAAIRMRDSLTSLLATADNKQFRYFKVKTFKCGTFKKALPSLATSCDTTNILVGSDFVPSRYNSIKKSIAFTKTLDSILIASDTPEAN